GERHLMLSAVDIQIDILCVCGYEGCDHLSAIDVSPDSYRALRGFHFLHPGKGNCQTQDQQRPYSPSKSFAKRNHPHTEFENMILWTSAGDDSEVLLQPIFIIVPWDCEPSHEISGNSRYRGRSRDRVILSTAEGLSFRDWIFVSSISTDFQF